MKPCPYCAEPIQDAAIKCRYCGSMLDGEAPPASQPQAATIPWLLVAAASIVIVALGVGLGMYARMAARQAAANPAPAAAPAASVAAGYLFADLPWGLPVSEVDTRLTGRGFRFTEQDEEGDHVFSGTAEGHEALVIAMLGDGVLVKVIEVVPSGGDPSGAAARVVRDLSAKYGAPSRQTPSAANGRGVTEWAFRADGSGQSRLWLTTTDTHDVAVHFESGRWAQEAARRRTRPH